MQPASRLNIGTIPPSGVRESNIELTAPVLVPLVAVGEEHGHRLTEADLLAFEIARRRVDAQRRQNRISGGLRPIGDADADDEENRHGGQNRPSLAHVADDAAESENGGDRNEQAAPRSR